MRKKYPLFILAASVFLLFEAGFAADEYRVGKRDVLLIEVFQEKDFSGTYRIDLNGNLNYPIIGDLPVDGKTIGQIRDELTRILEKDYLVEPKVTVSVKEFNSKKVTVIGSVKKPGVYRLREKTKILDILSMAGGVEKEGSRRIIVLRKEPPTNILPEKTKEKENGKAEVRKSEVDLEEASLNEKNNQNTNLKPLKENTDLNKMEGNKNNKDSKTEELDPLKSTAKFMPIMVNYDEIIKGKDLTQNIEVLGGDIVNVPKANEIFVLGSVKSPGPIRHEDKMGILQAISTAGGMLPEASPGSTYILRIGKNGKKEKIKVNFNKVLKRKGRNIKVNPDDVIVVPESFF